MQCWGRTPTFKRCKLSSKYFFCYHHRFQPFGLILFILTLIALFAGIFQDLIKPLFMDEEQPLSIADAEKLASQLIKEKKQALDSFGQREQYYQDLIKALTEAVTALSQQRNQPDAPPGIDAALAQLQQGNTEKAERIFEDILKRKSAEGQTANQQAAEAARHLGALAFLHDTDKALNAYRRAVSLDPENVEGWNQLGHLLQRVGDLDGSEKAYRKVLASGKSVKSDTWIAVAYGNLGIVYEIRGELDQAEAMYKKALLLFQDIGAASQVEQVKSLLNTLHESGQR